MFQLKINLSSNPIQRSRIYFAKIFAIQFHILIIRQSGFSPNQDRIKIGGCVPFEKVTNF